MNGDKSTISFRDAVLAVEFVCWVMVVLAPLLRWINGPAVTSDQFTGQVALFSLALTSAIGLRVYQLLRR